MEVPSDPRVEEDATCMGCDRRTLKRSATRKHKCLLGGVRPVVSHESEEPRRSNTPGSFLGKRSQHPQQSCLIGLGGVRLASSRLATRSVSEAAIGIPLLFFALRNLLICSLARSLFQEERERVESLERMPLGLGNPGFFICERFY